MSRNLTEQHIIELVKQHFTGAGSSMPSTEKVISFMQDLLSSKTLWIDYGEYVDWETTTTTPSTLPDGAQVYHPLIRKQTYTQSLLNGASVECEYCTMFINSLPYRLCRFSFSGMPADSYVVFPITLNPNSVLTIDCTIEVFTQAIKDVYESHMVQPDPEKEDDFVNGIIGGLINAGLIVETVVLGVATYAYVRTINGTMLSRPAGILWKAYNRGTTGWDTVEQKKWLPYFTKWGQRPLYPFYNASTLYRGLTSGAFGTAVTTTATCPSSFTIETAYPL